MTISNFPNGFANGVTIRGVPLTSTNPGQVFWVNNSTTALAKGGVGGSDGNPGTYQKPFGTIDYAIGKCTASRGDIVMVMPNHAETLAAVITMDVAGVAIVGMGNGTNRPAITGGFAGDLISITANNCSIHNLYFNEKTTASATSATIDIAAADVTVQNCHFDAGANEVLGITVTGAGEKVAFYNNVHVVTADGPDNFIQIEGVVDQPVFKDNRYVITDGTDVLDDGYAVSFESQAITNAILEGNEVIGNDGGSLLGGNASAGAVNVIQSGVRTVHKINGLVTSAAADALFHVTGGPVHILSIVGVVSTTIQAQANALKIQAAIIDPAGDTDMSTAVETNGDAVGTLYNFQGPTGILTPVTAGIDLLDVGHATLAPTQWVMTPGTIEAIGAAASTGGVDWSLSYVPLSPLSKVTAAA